MRSKKIIYSLVGVLVLLAGAGLFASYYNRADAQTVPGDNTITKSNFLQIQERRFDVMDTNGMNPGVMMGRAVMEKEQFMDMQADMYDLMSEYGVHPGAMIGGCPALMGGMMLSPWCGEEETDMKDMNENNIDTQLEREFDVDEEDAVQSKVEIVNDGE
jgi:hypothetical protein